MGKAEATKAKQGISYIRDYKMRSISTMSGSQYIDEVSIENFYSIKKIEKLKLGGAKEVYFLGENGDGKSLLLMAIHLAFNGNYIASDAVKVGDAQDMLKLSKNGKLSGKDVSGNTFGLDKKGRIESFIAYGANRSRYDSVEFDDSGFMSLYNNDCKLVSPDNFLRETYLKDTVREITKKEEPFYGYEGLRFKDIKLLFESLLDEKVRIEQRVVSRKVAITYFEKDFETVFRHLSDGFKNTLIWVSDLLSRLQANQPNTSKLSDLEGIVLVDEIDLHLHPQWQGSLVKKLRTAFPKIQFIFTAHSPAMLQGAGDDAVFFRVYREGEAGETKVSEPFFKKNMTHMMFNTLMTSPLFGLESARISPNTEDPDTNDSYLDSRVEEAVRKKLAEQRKAGKKFISPEEIDALIEEVMNTEVKG